MRAQYGDSVNYNFADTNQYIGNSRYDTNGLYQDDIDHYGLKARTVSGNWYQYTRDKPIVDVAKGSTDCKILNDQYGDRIQYNYGDGVVNNLKGDNEYRGNDRNDTNLDYMGMLSGLGVRPSSAVHYYDSKYDADGTGIYAPHLLSGRVMLILLVDQAMKKKYGTI